ncbi:MAG: 50S ribosomal protein L37e [Candidatus Nanohaloarchaea archaeon]
MSGSELGDGNKKSHGKCRRCGEKSYHLRKGVCANCGFGKTSKREDFDKDKPRKQ